MRRTPYEWFRRFTARFSDSPASVFHAFGAFVFFTSIRNLLEFWMTNGSVPAWKLVHYNLAYFELAFVLALWLHFVTGREIVAMLKLVFPGFIVTILPPTLDATIFRSLRIGFDYLPASSWADVGTAYLTWFGPLVSDGVTGGMRTEIAVVTLTAFFYVHAQSGNFIRALIGGVGTYTLLFATMAGPHSLKLISRDLGLEYALLPSEYSVFMALVAGLLIIVCFARAEPHLFRVLVRDSRPLRILHYELMFILGLVAYDGEVSWTLTNRWIRIFAAALAIMLIWIFAVMNNNVYDLESDRINAPERPLVRGEIDVARYERLSWFVGLMAIFFAATAGTVAFFAIVLFGAAYFTYSTPPLRLKEQCFVSKWVIGLNSTACVIIGHTLDSLRFTAPALLGWAVFAWFSLGSHLIDLKDIEGDRAAGIRNVSTMLGIDRAKKLIGGSAVVVHLGVAYLIGFNWLGVVIGAVGVLQFLIINRKSYRETPVLLLQNAVSLAVVVYVAVNSLSW
jgi:geranylgeranylglycerol-phosphate geranylgeranyltransferase